MYYTKCTSNTVQEFQNPDTSEPVYSTFTSNVRFSNVPHGVNMSITTAVFAGANTEPLPLGGFSPPLQLPAASLEVRATPARSWADGELEGGVSPTTSRVEVHHGAWRLRW